MSTPLDCWALVELMGHQRIVGKVSELELGAGKLIRVDVPSVDGQQAFTRCYGVSAIYCLSPISEAAALELIKKCRPEPVSVWEIPQIPATTESRIEYDGAEDDEEDDL